MRNILKILENRKNTTGYIDQVGMGTAKPLDEYRQWLVMFEYII